MMDQAFKSLRTEQNTVCFSGHRYLSQTERSSMRSLLGRAVQDCWNAGFRWFICGGALGFDTLAAEAVIAFRDQGHPEVGLYLALPCADQASHWQDADRNAWQRIRDAADDQIVLSPHYFSGCMQLRNQFMVQHASLCICYLRRFSGGTGYTVRFALSHGRRVVNLCLPDSSGSIKEPIWNSTFTSPFVSANVPTVRSIRSRVAVLRKWNGTHRPFCGKRKAGNHV